MSQADAAHAVALAGLVAAAELSPGSNYLRLRWLPLPVTLRRLAFDRPGADNDIGLPGLREIVTG